MNKALLVASQFVYKYVCSLVFDAMIDWGRMHAKLELVARSTDC